ncbi:5452_t:CDS:2, partial [Diversispora eburnea]
MSSSGMGNSLSQIPEESRDSLQFINFTSQTNNQQNKQSFSIRSRPAPTKRKSKGALDFILNTSGSGESSQKRSKFDENNSASTDEMKFEFRLKIRWIEESLVTTRILSMRSIKKPCVNFLTNWKRALQQTTSTYRTRPQKAYQIKIVPEKLVEGKNGRGNLDCGVESRTTGRTIG